MEKAPAIGDRVKVRPDINDPAAGCQGQVLRLRVRRDGIWLDVELNIDGVPRWFSREQIDYVTRPRGTVGAPKGDFVRVERRSGRRANELDLHLYVGRALLARWRETSGDFNRVVILQEDGRLFIRATPDARLHSMLLRAVCRVFTAIVRGILSRWLMGAMRRVSRAIPWRC
ncbi:hypothetical protein HC891_07025 [Candidatus Gracilibacteria bacterium]|nr:hypothetical protein [Candidatus Gracilibacteria bacterium]